MNTRLKIILIISISVAALAIALPSHAQVTPNNLWHANSASSTIVPNNPSLQVPCANIVGGCGGSGGSVSTSSPNTWTGNQQFSAGATDASSTHIVPTYTYSVCQNSGECDYTTLQAALAQASSTQAPTAIYVHGGGYAVPAGGYKVCSPSLTVLGDGFSTAFTFTNATGSAFTMCDGTQRSNFIFGNFKVTNSGSNTTSSIGADFDHMDIAIFENIKMVGFNQDYFASSTSQGAFYDKFINNTDAPTGTANFGYYFGIDVNDDLVLGSRVIANPSTTCYYFGSNHENNTYNADCETGALYGWYYDVAAHDESNFGAYDEANQTGLYMASTSVYSILFSGGFIADSTVSNLNNQGAQFTLQAMNVQYQQFNYTENQHGQPGQRWFTPYMSGIASTNAVFTSSTVELLEFELKQDAFVSGCSFVAGSATTTGNLMCGIYGPLVTPDTCAGATLKVQATSSAATVAINNPQFISFATPTHLAAGLYCMALAADNSTSTYQRLGNQTQVTGWTQTITKTGASSTLPNTVTSPTNSGSNVPSEQIQGSTLTTY